MRSQGEPSRNSQLSNLSPSSFKHKPTWAPLEFSLAAALSGRFLSVPINSFLNSEIYLIFQLTPVVFLLFFALTLFFVCNFDLCHTMPWWEFGSLPGVQYLMGFFQDNSRQRFGSSHHWTLLEYRNKELRMTDVTSGFHIKSHGTTVVRTHLHDWMILLLLGGVAIVLTFVHPFYRFVGKDVMYDLKYPFKENIVPFWAVVICAVGFPILAFVIVYFRKRCVYDLHHAILGLLYSLVVMQILTDAIKLSVGRPRPDFFWRCFPDGKDVYDKLGNVICHGKESYIREGHKSFPSGHTSWSFAGMAYLSLYLSGKIQAFDRRGHVAKLCISILPLLLATLIGISRVDNYRHHWTDVFAGGLLGLTVATMCYLQFFPLPSHVQGWGPYAFFRALEESSATIVNAAQTTGVGDDRDVGMQLVCDSPSREEDIESDYNPTAEDAESGKR